jgi:hypothetical protein
MIYIHENVVPQWMDYVKQRRATTDIRKAQSVAAKARAAGVALKEEAQ